ncbi:MAG TPA: HTH domain-containing protein [Balneolaceae bacterium]
MSLYRYITRIRRLDAMIRRKSTGSPKELADKLDISERWLYKFLEELKEEFDCPIIYDHYRESYVYEEQGEMIIGFRKNLSEKEKKKVSGGRMFKKFEPLYVFVQ